MSDRRRLDVGTQKSHSQIVMSTDAQNLTRTSLFPGCARSSGGGGSDDVRGGVGGVGHCLVREGDSGAGLRRHNVGRSTVAGSVVNHVTGLLAKRCGMKTSSPSTTTPAFRLSAGTGRTSDSAAARDGGQLAATPMRSTAHQGIETPTTTTAMPATTPASPANTGCSLLLCATSSSRPPPSPRPLQPSRQSSLSLDYCNSPGLPLPNVGLHPLSSADQARCFTYGSSSGDGPVGERQHCATVPEDSSSVDADDASGTVPAIESPTASGASPATSSPVTGSPPPRSSTSGISSPPTRSGGGRNRFKKILRPLRRTRSAGCGDDLNDPDAHDRHFGLPGPFGRRAVSTKSSSLTPV